MIAVIQRVSEAAVRVQGQIIGEIQKGLLILLGVGHSDSKEDIDWLVKKIIALRIFSDENSRMNLSCTDIDGEYLVVSQFTLLASTKKGNRPSYTEAALPEKAIPLYNEFMSELEKASSKTIQTGEFGADMKVSLTNDGPVTIVIDTKNKR